MSDSSGFLMSMLENGGFIHGTAEADRNGDEKL
jgi:hypothetical protein